MSRTRRKRSEPDPNFLFERMAAGGQDRHHKRPGSLLQEREAAAEATGRQSVHADMRPRRISPGDPATLPSPSFAAPGHTPALSGPVIRAATNYQPRCLAPASIVPAVGGHVLRKALGWSLARRHVCLAAAGLTIGNTSFGIRDP